MARTHTFPLLTAILCGVVTCSAQIRHFGFPLPVTIGDKYGFMDAGCNLVIPAQYDEAFEFSDGMAAVKVGQKWGYIDEQGVMVIQPKFAGAWFFSDELASVKLDENSPLWGFADKKGEIVIKPQFGMPLLFKEGLVEGYGEKNKILNVPLGYVDKRGNYVVRLTEPGWEIEFLLEFSEGLARVAMMAKYSDGSVGPEEYGYIDHSGSWVIRHSFPFADDFHEGLAAVESKNKRWGYIDKTGKLVISARFESASEFSEGLAAVKVDGLWGWIDKSGEMVIAPSFDEDEVFPFRSGMAGLVHHRKIGYINVKGEMVIRIRSAKHRVDDVREASLEMIRPVCGSGSRQWA